MRNNEELVMAYQQTTEKVVRKEILEELINANKGIVYKRAWSYHNTKAIEQLQGSISLEDLQQEGKIAITTAANTYEFDKGALFITYVVKSIDWRMWRLLEKRYKNPDIREVSLQAPVGKEEDGYTLGDVLSDKDNFVYKKNPYEAVDDEIFYKQIREQAEELMKKKLNQQEQLVLKMYVGWTAAPTTLEEIGKILSLSKGWTGDIKDNACMKLRRTSWARELQKEYTHERAVRKFLKKNDSFKDTEKWENSRSKEELVRQKKEGLD